jgi:hypothetical protein
MPISIYRRPAQPFMWWRQLRQDLVCMWAIWNSIHTISIRSCTCYFPCVFITSCGIKIYRKQQEKFIENVTYNLSKGVTTFSVFLRHELVKWCMSAQINSWTFFKTASAFYLSFAKERVKIRFLISKVFAGNITLCREQHVARELRVAAYWLTATNCGKQTVALHPRLTASTFSQSSPRCDRSSVFTDATFFVFLNVFGLSQYQLRNTSCHSWLFRNLGTD